MTFPRLIAASALAAGTSSAQPAVEKDSKPTGVPTYEGRDPGDTIEDPFVIDYLPFYGTGDTCPFINDYDACCPYTGSTSPDVVYAYEPAADMCVSISLCNSFYDTKVFVYEDAWTPGSPVACNDDNFDCVDPPVDYTSWIEEVELLEGQTYYIVVDGYGNQCGDYVLEVEEIYCGPE